MSNKTYRTIGSSLKTLEVLDIIAGSVKAVTAPDIARTLEMKYDTVMCHLSTLEKAGYIERFGDGYMTTLKLATFYAKKTAQLQSQKQKIDEDLSKIGA